MTYAGCVYWNSQDLHSACACSHLYSSFMKTAALPGFQVLAWHPSFLPDVPRLKMKFDRENAEPSAIPATPNPRFCQQPQASNDDTL